MSSQGSSCFCYLEDTKKPSLKFVRKKGGPQRTMVGPAPSLGPLIGPSVVRGLLMDIATVLQRTTVVPGICLPKIKRTLISCIKHSNRENHESFGYRGEDVEAKKKVTKKKPKFKCGVTYSPAAPSETEYPAVVDEDEEEAAEGK
ncbi:unnamed protein product, partial [Cyprideis torosa]